MIEDSPRSIRSASHTSESPSECKRVSQDDDEDKGRMRGQPHHMAASASHPKLGMSS